MVRTATLSRNGLSKEGVEDLQIAAVTAQKAIKSFRGKATAVETVTIPPLKIETFQIKIVGDSPLITNKWSEKAKSQIRDKQTKQARGAKEAKRPEQDYENSMHRLPDGTPGFPVIGFKAAAVTACSHVSAITKVVARGAFHVSGELAPIKGKPRMREDMVRIAMGTADIRYRAEFPEWSTVLTVRHNPNVMSASQIINLFNTAGFAVGVGEWRPEKDGSYGMFHVEPAN